MDGFDAGGTIPITSGSGEIGFGMTQNKEKFPFVVWKLALVVAMATTAVCILAIGVAFGWHVGQVLAAQATGPTHSTSDVYNHVVCIDG